MRPVHYVCNTQQKKETKRGKTLNSIYTLNQEGKKYIKIRDIRC